MNVYEGMYIFPEDVNDDVLEDGIKAAREEIEKLGGQVDSVTRLGRRGFARMLRKKEAGLYVVIGFQLDGDKVQALNNRYKLTDKIFRTQIVRVRQTETAEPAATEA